MAKQEATTAWQDGIVPSISEMAALTNKIRVEQAAHGLFMEQHRAGVQLPPAKQRDLASSYDTAHQTNGSQLRH